MAESGMSLRERVEAWWNGDREYRFPNEEANHIDQRQQTEVSIGLMAVAATHSDDEHRLQALQTETTLRDRKGVLDTKRAAQGLTEQERWELASINRGLDALIEPPKATPEALGEQRLAAFGDVAQRPRGFLGAVPALAGVAVRPWMLWSGALAAVALWGGYNDVRAGRLENERNEARTELANTERDLIAANAERDLLRDAASQADAQSQQAAATIEAERARRLRAEREARSIRNEMEQARAGGPVSYGFDGVRNTEPDN